MSAEETRPFQRIGSLSNTHAGNDFEAIAAQILAAGGISVTRNFAIPIGVGSRQKSHRFDLGSASPAVLVECKSHRWTSGGNMPSAKLTVWTEAMYYFSLAPTRYRKIFFVLKDLRRGESLCAYYLRVNRHLIPEGVEVWEHCTDTNATCVMFPPLLDEK